MRIAYIILAHADPHNVARLAARLAAAGGAVAVHYDLKAPAAEFADLEAQLTPIPDEPDHKVACLHDAALRRRIWEGLAAGQEPDAMVRLVQANGHGAAAAPPGGGAA